MKGCKSIHFFIGDQCKISQIFSRFTNRLLFVGNGNSTFGCFLYFKELRVCFLMCFLSLVFYQFPIKAGDPFIKGRFIFCSLFDTVVVMDINPAFFPDGISFVWSFLSVIPLRRYRISVGIRTLIKVHCHSDILIYGIQMFPDKCE